MDNLKIHSMLYIARQIVYFFLINHHYNIGHGFNGILTPKLVRGTACLVPFESVTDSPGLTY